MESAPPETASTAGTASVADGTLSRSGTSAISIRREPSTGGVGVETNGILGTLWMGIGLGAYFLALTWINVLLGSFLSPLFIVPMTWLQDRIVAKPSNRR